MWAEHVEDPEGAGEAEGKACSTGRDLLSPPHLRVRQDGDQMPNSPCLSKGSILVLASER